MYGTVERVEALIVSIVDTRVLQTITPEEIGLNWLDELDRAVIDAELEPFYAVPFTTVTRGALTYYPYLLQEISAHLSAGSIVAEKLAQGEPQISERGLALVQWAMEEIGKLKLNQVRLEGQRKKSDTHFRSSRLMPATPATPAAVPGGPPPIV